MTDVKVTVQITTVCGVESANGVIEKQTADYVISNPVIDHSIVEMVKDIITEYVKDNKEEPEELPSPA